MELFTVGMALSLERGGRDFSREAVVFRDRLESALERLDCRGLGELLELVLVHGRDQPGLAIKDVLKDIIGL
jgi:hypothetical protein